MIKLVWEFRGPDALSTAKHHEIHLKEYAKRFELNAETGTEPSGSTFWAYLIVHMNHLEQIKKDLRPHRGFNVTGE